MGSGIWALRPLVSMVREENGFRVGEGDWTRDGGGVEMLAAWGDPVSGGEALEAALAACWMGKAVPKILAGSKLASAWGEGWIEGGEMARGSSISEVWLHALTLPVKWGSPADLRAFSAEADAALPRLAESLKRFGLDSVKVQVPAALAPRKLAELVAACVAEARARREAEAIEAACAAGVAKAARGL